MEKSEFTLVSPASRRMPEPETHLWPSSEGVLLVYGGY